MKTKGTDVPSYNVLSLPVKFSLIVKTDKMIFPEINHWHDDWEFIYVSKGKVGVSINGKKYNVYEGQLLFINSKQMHYTIWDTEEDYVYKQITIHPDLLFGNGFMDGCRDKLCGENLSPFLVFSKGSQKQKTIIDCVNLCFENILKGKNELEITAGIYVLVSKLTEYLENRPRAKTFDDKNLYIMFKMISYIQENYKKTMTIADIGKAGNIGRSKCCELFKYFWNLSPNDYLNRYRLWRSIILLNNMEMSVGDIALSSGFNGASYYSEIFKKTINMTPSEYRKKMKVTFDNNKIF